MKDGPVSANRGAKLLSRPRQDGARRRNGLRVIVSADLFDRSDELAAEVASKGAAEIPHQASGLLSEL